ncbi:hypothetical protein BLN97_39735 [Bradyrhizobium elkanii]|nr:hypothetical protein BLN97_39735 [Bradyrhizobium elkanii]
MDHGAERKRVELHRMVREVDRIQRVVSLPLADIDVEAEPWAALARPGQFAAGGVHGAIAQHVALGRIGADMALLDDLDVEYGFPRLLLLPIATAPADRAEVLPELRVRGLAVHDVRRQRWKMAAAAMFVVELGSHGGLGFVDRRKAVGPGWRIQSGEGFRHQRQVLSSELLFDPVQIIEGDAAGKTSPLGRGGEVELRRNPHRLAGIAHQWLHNRAVVLHPIEP